MSSPESMRFFGVAAEGCGRFAEELILPTKDRLSQPIRDWPDLPAEGTLNVHIEESGFPPEYLANFKEASFRCLDTRLFVPEAELPWTDIGGNTLPPTPSRPDRGRAQVWRATIINVKREAMHLCWVLRRIGSALRVELELVADENLRNAMLIEDGTKVEVRMEGTWKRAVLA
jgi:hypothetical protein